jgi:hypothetical protein
MGRRWTVIRSATIRATLRETLGFCVVAAGLFLLISLVSYDAADHRYRLIRPDVYRNLGGPVGAFVGHVMLHSIGLVSAVWTVALIAWGLLMAFGFVLWPKPAGLIALSLITFVLAALADLQLPESPPVNLPGGFGGAIGASIATVLLQSVGHGGSLIILGLMTMAILAMTGYLRASRIGRLFELAVYSTRRFLARRNLRDPTRTVEQGDEGAAGRALQSLHSTRSNTDSAGAPGGNGAWFPNFSSGVPTHERPAPEIFHRSEPSWSDIFVSSRLRARLQALQRDPWSQPSSLSLHRGPKSRKLPGWTMTWLGSSGREA